MGQATNRCSSAGDGVAARILWVVGRAEQGGPGGVGGIHTIALPEIRYGKLLGI
jgi:hypothetical protein